MKVRDLITELQALDQDLPVIVAGQDGDLSFVIVDRRWVTITHGDYIGYATEGEPGAVNAVQL